MKKIIEKDKLRRFSLKEHSIKKFILKSISKNYNFTKAVQYNAFSKLKIIAHVNNSSVSIINKCLLTKNKKRFFKRTFLARQAYLKSIRFGFESGVRKSSW